MKHSVVKVGSYAVIGSVGAVIHLLVVAIGSFYISQIGSFIAGFLVSNYWSYFFNSKFTFSHRRSARTFSRYIAVTVSSLVLSTVIFYLVQDYSFVVATIVAMVFGVGLQFTCHSIYTFKKL